MPSLPIFCSKVGATPSRMLGFIDVLCCEGGACDRDRLERLMMPRTLRASDDKHPAAVADCVAVASDLEIASVDGLKRIALANSALWSTIHVPEDRSSVFRSYCEARMLSPHFGGKPNAFARVACWFIGHYAGRNPVSRDEVQASFESAGRNLDEYELRNDARWDMVFYWMRFLGLCERVSLRQSNYPYCGDVTAILAHSVGDLLGPQGAWMPASTFRKNLGSRLPILDGGSIWQEVWGESDGSASTCLSLALMRLKHRGLLALDYRDDARDFLTLELDTCQRVSAVKWI